MALHGHLYQPVGDGFFDLPEDAIFEEFLKDPFFAEQTHHPLLHLLIFSDVVVDLLQEGVDEPIGFLPQSYRQENSYYVFQQASSLLGAKLVQAVHKLSDEPVVLLGKEDVLDLVLLVVANYLLHDGLVVLLPRDGLLAGQHPLLAQLLLPLVNQHVGIFNLLLRVVAGGLTPVGLLSNIIKIEIPYHCVIELEPLAAVPVLDKGVVVATISVAQVHDHSLQDVAEVFRG